MAGEFPRQVIRQYTWNDNLVGYRNGEIYIPVDDPNADYISIKRGLAEELYFEVRTNYS